MNINQIRPISARAAEHLLDGTGGDAEHPRLAATLRAAAGPPRPGELAGRPHALAAFHRAHAQRASAPRRRSAIKSGLVKLLTLKAAAVAAVVLGTGGVALAAHTGALPNPLNHPAPAASAARSHASDRPEASEHPGSDANPSPSLVGLCHAYTAGAGSEHGKALENPAFRALLTAAGGKANVDAYCARLLASAHPGGTPNGQAGKPREQPSAHPTDHPTDKPSTHPSH